MPTPIAEPAVRYLELLARCLTRELFLDEEVRNVDLRDWPLGDPDELKAVLRERGWRVVQARSRGDEAAYRDFADRYRALATSLGFEGHIAIAEAMT